jgi:hypothetical protein
MDDDVGEGVGSISSRMNWLRRNMLVSLPEPEAGLLQDRGAVEDIVAAAGGPQERGDPCCPPGE